ncbi:MAG: hypothetical protein H7343_15485 [Undibacterium sp.]|nr:hypothetical protein [Opitutaceae bacterium]
MTQSETLQAHQQLCDDLHQCALEENRFLRLHQRSPEADQLERKRTLLARLDESLGALRTLPAASARDPQTQAQLERTRARILQILQLDQENEQLLLRCSLTAGRATTTPVAPSAALLQKIYARCTP